MSAATAPPTPDAGSEARPPDAQGSHGPNGSEAAPATQASSDPSARADSGRDYLARIRSNPDFATEEVRKHQSAAAKAAEELRSLRSQLGEDLNPYLQQGVSGQVIAQALREYQALTQNPQIAQAVESYRKTGQLQLPGAPAQPRGEGDETGMDDPYLTDAERAMQQQIEALRSETTQLKSLLGEQSKNFGVQSLSQHLERAFTEYGLSGDRAETVRQKLLQQVSSWQAQGDVGQRALRDLQDTQRGRETVELMVAKALGPKGLLEVAREQAQRESQSRAGMATDSPSGFGTTGDEPPAEHRTVAEAIRTARARPEVLARYS